MLGGELRGLHGKVFVLYCHLQKLSLGLLERDTFSHGAEYVLPSGIVLLASYHPSLRNTNTGRLDSVMFARVFARARELAGL